MSSRVPSSSWAAVVEAEERFAEAVAAIPPGEMRDFLYWALSGFASRRAALRVLGGADPHLTASVLPALEPLLLVSHALLLECRRVVLRLPQEELLDYLGVLTEKVVQNPSSDYEAYRRLAELLRAAGAQETLRQLVGAAERSADADVREVGEDFA